MESNRNDFDIVWTKTAFKSFDLNIEFIRIKWNDIIVERFISRTDEIVKNIKVNPLLYPRSISFKNYHKAIIHKNVSLYYRIDISKIYLILFWDNRQNPKFLKELLSKI